MVHKVLVSGGLALAGVALIALAPAPSSAGGEADPRVEHGRYLVAISGCNDCHTPLAAGERGDEPDRARLLAGDRLPAVAGAPGVLYASNLTPDLETGLGRWSEERFVRAMRSGRSSTRALPRPLASAHLPGATDDDLAAIWAYLRSIPPVVHAPPPATPAR
jgi:mono/diheme cytochrome c family protein